MVCHSLLASSVAPVMSLGKSGYVVWICLGFFQYFSVLKRCEECVVTQQSSVLLWHEIGTHCKPRVSLHCTLHLRVQSLLSYISWSCFFLVTVNLQTTFQSSVPQWPIDQWEKREPPHFCWWLFMKDLWGLCHFQGNRDGGNQVWYNVIHAVSQDLTLVWWLSQSFLFLGRRFEELSRWEGWQRSTVSDYRCRAWSCSTAVFCTAYSVGVIS